MFSWLVPAFAVWPEALSAPAVASHGASPGAVGWWLMAIPAGTTIGEVAALWWISPTRRPRLLRPLAAAGFVPFLLFAFAPALLPSLGLLVLAGLGAAYIPGMDALLLEETPEDLRGRVFTLSTAGLMTTQGLGFAASGAVAEVLSVNATITLAGLAGLTVVACIRPRRAPRPAPAELAASA